MTSQVKGVSEEKREGWLNRQFELASKSHQAYLNKDKNQDISDRLDLEIRRLELARKLKYDNQVSENEIRNCEDVLSLLHIIKGDYN